MTPPSAGTHTGQTVCSDVIIIIIIIIIVISVFLKTALCSFIFTDWITWINKLDNAGSLLCLHVADPATFLASNSVLGAYCPAGLLTDGQFVLLKMQNSESEVWACSTCWATISIMCICFVLSFHVTKMYYCYYNVTKHLQDGYHKCFLWFIACGHSYLSKNNINTGSEQNISIDFIHLKTTFKDIVDMWHKRLPAESRMKTHQQLRWDTKLQPAL